MRPPNSSADARELLDQLQQQIRLKEGTKPPTDDTPLSTTCLALDKLLPEQGWRRGSVVEWLSPGQGSGAGLLALLTARQAYERGGAVVICQQRAAIYPPALAQLGFDLSRVVLVCAPDATAEHWAIDQALRSPAVAVVWAKLAKLDDLTSRRFQLAAESGGALGMFVRPSRIRGQPSWAHWQLAVEPLPTTGDRQWRLELLRSRGPITAQALTIQWNDLTHVLDAVSNHETPPMSLARA